MIKSKKYLLPSHWIWVKLGEVCIIKSGGTPSRKSYKSFNGDIPWVKSGELKYNVIIQTEESITKHAIERSSIKIFPRDTILVALYGSTVGRLAILGIEAATNQAVAALIPPKSLYNKFVYFFLMYKKQHLLHQRQGGAQPNISQKTLTELDFPLPPHSEQNLIVNKIEELFSGLDNAETILNRAKDKLEIYRLSVLQNKFRINQKIKHNLDNKGWYFTTLGKLFVFKGGGTPSKKQENYWNGKIPWATVKDINKKYLNSTFDKITIEGFKNSTSEIAKKGSVILVTRISPGRVTIANIDVAINQDLKIIHPKETFSSEFIYFLFQAYNKEILKLSSGTTVQGVNLSQLLNIKVLLPPLELHDEIVRDLEYKYSIVTNFLNEISKTLDSIAIQRQSILKKAYTGTLVSNFIDESTSKLFLQIKEEINSYLIKQRNVPQRTNQMNIFMSSNKSILEVLQEAGKPLPAKTVWLNSCYENKIEEFYSALKTHIENGEIKELLPRRGRESFLALK